MKKKKSIIKFAVVTVSIAIVLLLSIKFGYDFFNKSILTSEELQMQDSQSLYMNWGSSYDEVKAELDKNDPSEDHEKKKSKIFLLDHIDNFDGREALNANIIYVFDSKEDKLQTIYIRLGENLDSKTIKELSNKYKYLFNKQYTKTNILTDYIFKSKCWKNDESFVQILKQKDQVVIVYQDLEYLRSYFNLNDKP